MKMQILPNWCKKLGLTLFFVGSIIGGVDDARYGFLEGFYDGLNGNEYRTTKIVKVLPYFKENTKHIFSVLSIIGMLIYMVSKEKIEDDYINKLRLESYQLTLIVGLVLAIILFAFSKKMKIHIDVFITLFMWFYLITFFFKKRIDL